MKLSSDTERDMAYDQLAHYFDKKMLMLEQEKRQVKREIHQEHANTWEVEQHKATRLEWDLSDPDMLKKDLPGRIADADHRLGVSAAQIFAGEDLKAGERKKLQLAQQRYWCEQQGAESQARKDFDARTEANYQSLKRAQNEHETNVAIAEADARKNLARQIAADNLQTAYEKGMNKQNDSHNTQSTNSSEQFYTFNSAFMSEDPSTAQSYAAGHRKRMDHYKGMSDNEKQNVLNFQAMQRDELAQKRADEADEETAYAQYQENVRRQLNQTHSKMEEFKQKQREAVASHRNAQHDEKKNRDNHLQHTVYTNVPSEDYFGQFGRCHR